MGDLSNRSQRVGLLSEVTRFGSVGENCLPMTNYGLDPEKPRQLTPEEKRRLAKTQSTIRTSRRLAMNFSRKPNVTRTATSHDRRAGRATEIDTLWIFPAGADLSFFEAQPERVLEIAIRAFATAKARAIAENDRLGIPSYGTEDDAPTPDRASGRLTCRKKNGAARRRPRD